MAVTPWFRRIALLGLTTVMVCAGTLFALASEEAHSRRLAPECIMLVYTQPDQAPSSMPATSGSCPEGGASRAFLLDVGSDATRAPQLKEVSPRAQTYACTSGLDCMIVAEGFGLSRGDRVMVVAGEAAACPPLGSGAAVRTVGSAMETSRSVTTDAKGVISSDDLPARDLTTLAVFDLGRRFDSDGASDGDKYTVCYAPKLAIRDSTPQPKDFLYSAGTIEIKPKVAECDFESNFCGMTLFKDHQHMDLKWERHQGPTETEGTGPAADHTVGEAGDAKGTYIVFDSPGYLPGATATLLSQPLLLPRGKYCSSFWYHMSGDDVNSLRVFLHPVVDGKPVTGDWGRPSWLLIGDQGREWQEAGFEFEADGSAIQQVVVQALAGYSEKGDIALDDFKIERGRCPVALRESTPYAKDYICGEVRLKSGNWSEDKSWYLEGAVSCAGRGYSYDQLRRATFLPCCVPSYGNYTLVLRDAFGDGWDNSILEFNFFDANYQFGQDFDKLQGHEKKYEFVVGLLRIERIEGSEESIAMEVRVLQPESRVWCGAAVAGSAAPSVDILKRYGIRSIQRTTEANQIVRMKIENKPDEVRTLKRNANYDVFCYAESSLSDASLQGTVGATPSAARMDDKQVQASRTLVTTDSQVPNLEVRNVRLTFAEGTVSFSLNEPGTVWCMAVEDSPPASASAPGSKPAEPVVPSMSVLKESAKAMSVPAAEANKMLTYPLTKLMPDTQYKVYCAAEDRAMPDHHRTSNSAIVDNVVVASTTAKVPVLTIESHKVFSRGFKVSLRLDTPGTAWCGAAMAGSAFPSKADVRRVGATAVVSDITEPAELEIRGVPKNTRYTIYCFAASRSGKLEMSDTDMWDTALEVTSFGKFCALPTHPKEIADGKATPFDSITTTEEYLVRDFILGQRELGLDGVYRITLWLDKDAVMQYLDNNGPMPPRFARVRVGTCEYGKGYYKQYTVGPLDSGEARQMSYKLLTEPVETECGGYTPHGVFGRRLLDLHHHDDFGRILKESFGYAFGEHEDCKNMNDKRCLEFGPTFYETPDMHLHDAAKDGASSPTPPPMPKADNSTSSDQYRTWVGLRTPDGHSIPFYFVFLAPEVDVSKPSVLKQQLMDHHYNEVDGFWYDGKMFHSLDELIEAYDSGSLKQVTPAILTERRLLAEERQEEKKRQRRLAPLDTNIPGPSPAGRVGLEYRAAPEHVESQGKRFTIRASPGAETYTIDYAGWEMVVNNDRDTALRLWNVKFNGHRVAFEMGLMEALAHYTVAERNWYFLDSWYGGLGAAARKLHPGVECAKTGHVIFWDESLCVFEIDMGRPIRSHWKSGALRDGAPHHALVLRQMLTVSNYDYVTDYYFHLSGSMEGIVSFTGELYAGVEVPWFSSRQDHYGTQVTGSMRMGALHSHMAVWKIDFDVDNYKENSVMWKEVVRDPLRPVSVYS
eukprot:GHVT01011799.1.p1 GENE.GHVT01011799.1~~GHVT01011799.1.p1  ORF type:complete len:1438 (-),score=210.57 GHVT01011799.1:2078-6391(-)